LVAAFVGAPTLLEGEAQADGALAVGRARLPLALPGAAAGRRVRVAVRPEDVALHADGGGVLAATVVESAYLGHGWRVVARIEDGTELAAFSPESLAPGTAVGLTPRRGTMVEGQG
jgi:ABC-type Fe3+/spermidine/putrescine transport system ATPase subunit